MLVRRRAAIGADERGAVLVVVTIAMVVMIGSTALAVDIGQMTNNNRTLQAVADVDRPRRRPDSRRPDRRSPCRPPAPAFIAAQASATRNNFPLANLTVDLGT